MRILVCTLLLLGLIAAQDTTPNVAIFNPGDIVPALSVPLLNGTLLDTATLNRPLLVGVYSPSDVFSR